jgi:alpha-tubulin suppressor-like RCC1 family protein
MYGFRRIATTTLVAALVACGQDIGPAGVPDLSGQWVFSQWLLLGPEDECGASGTFVLAQTQTSFTGTVMAQGPTSGTCAVIPPTGAIQDGRLSDSSITFSYGLCHYAGTAQGANVDSLAGTFTCSTLTGTGTWFAFRLGPATALTLTNWPNHPRIVVGGTVLLGAVLRDAAGHALFGPPLAWISDNAAVVSVTGPSAADGMVSATGVGTGSATVTATSSGFSASARFSVSQVRFASVSAGWTGTCGVAVAGDPWCWGWPVGDSTYYESDTPVPVSGGLALASVSVGGGGGGTACGVAGGAVHCWGAWPVAVPSAAGFGSVSVGGSHSCGLKTGGAAWCWGFDLNGELGTGSTTAPEQCSGYPCSTTPVAVAGGLTFVAVSAGAVHSCGLTAGGAAWCWGFNQNGGQLGDGSTTNRNSPVAVTGGLTFTAVSAGGDHTCGVATGGAAYCWGLNLYGELGTGSVTGPQQCSGLYACSTTPVAVSGGLTFSSVSAGEQHSCGVTTAGQAYCWGLNAFGQLGNGSTTDSSSPVAVSGGLTFVSVSAGLGNAPHSCGLTTGGVIYCWGSNYSGQLGNGGNVSSGVPVRVAGQP